MAVLVVCVVAFVFGFVGSMPLAGPVAVLIVSTAFRGEFKNALKLDLGASIAEGAYASLAFWGFATFLARHDEVIPIAHAVTAVVLLAIGGYFATWTMKDKAPKKDRKASFWVGLSVSAINPTLLVTWSAAVAWVYAHRLVHITGLLAVPWGIAAAAGVAAWFVVLVALIKRFHEHFPRKVITWIVRAMGIALVGLSAWSAVEFVKTFIK